MSQTVNGKAVPPDAELPRTELPQPELGRPELPRTELGRPELPRTELGRTELGRTELGRPELDGPELDRVAPPPSITDIATGVLSQIDTAAAIRAVPDVVKLTGAMVWRTNRWALNASLHVGGTVLRGAISGQSAGAVIDELSGQARSTVRELLGVADEPATVRGGDPAMSLRDRLGALLDASSDLTYPDSGHPAYVRLLSELAPDEARILRLFAERGAQPSVDVRTRRPFGVGSQLVAPGLTMIGRYAGCQYVDRVPAYMNNMFRLGLIWFSREALTDQSLYDVLEAQEDVEAAMRRAGNGVTVRRSIELTAFGRNLCAMTGLLPPEEEQPVSIDDPYG